MKKKYVFFSILILVLLIIVIYCKFINKDFKNEEILNKTIIEQTLLKENFKIKGLYLEKCKDEIVGKKLIGIRFILDYIYTSPSFLQDDVSNFKIKIIFPEKLIELLMTDMFTINISCSQLNSSILENINYEIYGNISENDVEKFINQENQFRVMLYKNDILIDDIIIKNIIYK